MGLLNTTNEETNLIDSIMKPMSGCNTSCSMLVEVGLNAALFLWAVV